MGPDDHSDAKAWVNEALRAAAAAEAGGTVSSAVGGPAMRLSVLLTKLQLSLADVDDETGRQCAELAGMAPGASRELALVHEQAGAVREELDALLELVGALEARSEAAVAPLRKTLRVRDRFAAAARVLAARLLRA